MKVMARIPGGIIDDERMLQELQFFQITSSLKKKKEKIN